MVRPTSRHVFGGRDADLQRARGLADGRGTLESLRRASNLVAETGANKMALKVTAEPLSSSAKL